MTTFKDDVTAAPPPRHGSLSGAKGVRRPVTAIYRYSRKINTLSSSVFFLLHLSHLILVSLRNTIVQINAPRRLFCFDLFFNHGFSYGMGAGTCPTSAGAHMRKEGTMPPSSLFRVLTESIRVLNQSCRNTRECLNAKTFWTNSSANCVTEQRASFI